MIKRSVYDTILRTISAKPVTLITGARQVGKTTLCNALKDEIGAEYVTLADHDERELAKRDPYMFLAIHKAPLIIDEVQYAPELFQEIESIVDRERLRDPLVNSLFILASSQSYGLMKDVTQSLSGRIGIVTVPTISLCEEAGVDERPFRIDPIDAFAAGSEIEMTDLPKKVIRGMYPELLMNDRISAASFYSDYVDTYIMRDVSEMVNVQDKDRFRSFMEVVASLTGQELVYETITKAIGADVKTIKRWLSVLVAGDIIRLLEPYSDVSVTKRVSKRPKIYFKDTGLACFLARIPDERILFSSYLKGPMMETFIVNEIIKTHENKGLKTPFFYYRDNNNVEIDLVMLYDGVLSMIECRSGHTYDKGDIKAFDRLSTNLDRIGCIVCNCNRPYPITREVYALPLRSVGMW